MSNQIEKETDNATYSEQDLINKLTSNPDISITEASIGDVFIIRRHDKNDNLIEELKVSLEEDSSSLNLVPKLSYCPINTKTELQIWLTPEGNTRVRFTDYSTTRDNEITKIKQKELRRILRFAKSGLDIMHIYKGIPLEEKEYLENWYCYIIKEAQRKDYLSMQSNDCLPIALNSINKALGLE